MSAVTKAILTDETGQEIVAELEDIKTVLANQSPIGNPVKIMVVTPPIKTQYSIGETFDPTGIGVSVVYSNNTMIDVTNQCTYDDTPLDTIGDTTITISYLWYPTGQTFTATQAISVGVCTWANGTDEQLAMALEAHYAGDIDIHDWWNVGDERTVHLSEIVKMTGENDNCPEQDVVFVLTEEGGKVLSSDGVTECAFQFDQKSCLGLYTGGALNSTDTNVGGWEDSPRRSWLSTNYRNALPSGFKAICKQFKNLSGTSTSVNVTLDEYFSLRAEKELIGSAMYGPSNEASELSQISWYETATNRKKTRRVNDQYGDRTFDARYWTRTIDKDTSTRFVNITGEGAALYRAATNTDGIAPFGCI